MSAKYSYEVNVHDINSKRTFIARQLYDFTDQFTSNNHLIEVLHSEIKTDLSADYSMGYFEGRSHSKQWLVSDEDVKS